MKKEKVCEILKSNNIIMHIEQGTKKEIIENMVDAIPTLQEDRQTREEILKTILKRESIESTGIGKGIAIPHAKSDNIKDFHIILGISKPGVDFAALDGKPVKIIFLVLSAEKNKVLYIRILARLARLLHNQDFRKGLLEQENEEKIVKFISQYESF
jgi:fructose-specific phosphotransferase system IIA component